MNRQNYFHVMLDQRAKKNVPLAQHTTFRVGGSADWFMSVRQLDELIQVIQRARETQMPIRILGNGSNILVRDGGVRGLVIENHCEGFTLDVINAQHALLRAESGAALPGLANRFARAGWAGLEWGIGVPGTIGGAVVGNAGAHHTSIADCITQVTIVNAENEICTLPKTELALDYRHSRFKNNRAEIILSAEFELTRDEPQNSIARMNAYTEHRRRTQPTEASVGSIFKNPPGQFAGQLIERAGMKGMRVGNIQVSEAHANFFVNRGGGTARQVLELIDQVRARVAEKFGVALELEIEIVGED
ncbi:MAG: UDP-N-acetylmuramate dehydrogenase [Chloroflexi bacterium]|nr:UDP-N-acetylmuramate dehydrogenase [Chloroflexota bacterium]